MVGWYMGSQRYPVCGFWGGGVFMLKKCSGIEDFGATSQ